MHRKMSAARKGAFLRALAATGNVTLAAERAGVSRSWVRKRRGEDAVFDAACIEAIGAASGTRARGGAEAPKGWGFFDGVELVVRGSNRRTIQIARARLKQWTPRLEERFLEMLAAACNVKMACAAVGMTAPAVYAHRKRRPAFARRWDAAILAGYERIEGGLTAAAIAMLDPHLAEDLGVAPPDDPVVAPIAFNDAIRLLRLHEKRAREEARRRMGWPEAGPAWPGRR